MTNSAPNNIILPSDAMVRYLLTKNKREDDRRPTPSGVAAYFSSSSDDDDDEVDAFDGWRRRRARGGTAVGGVTAVRRAIVEVRRNKIALGLGTCTRNPRR